MFTKNNNANILVYSLKDAYSKNINSLLETNSLNKYTNCTSHI